MDRSLALRAGLVQALLVGAASAVLALALPTSFFEDWGWLSGPLVWGACAILTAILVGLPIGWTILGAGLAGIPSMAAVIAGVHWLGVILAVIVFALWVGWIGISTTKPVSDPPLSDPPLVDEDRALLEKHKPVLRFDPQFDYRTLSARSITDNPGNLLRRADGEVIARADPDWDPVLSLELLAGYPDGFEPGYGDHLAEAPDYAGDARRMQRDRDFQDRAYGRVVREEGGRTWLQYWFWLYYNPKNLLGFGSHEGDWEMIQIGLGAGGEPECATYSQHTWAASRGWKDVQRFPTRDGPRPIVYVAALSHASYFEPGTHPYLGGVDHAYRGGPDIDDLVLEDFGDWVYWPGRWGNLSRILRGKFGNGPNSPARQGRKWTSPTRFHTGARARVLSRAIGRVLLRIGRMTFPGQPKIMVRRSGRELEVSYELPQKLNRRTAHLYLTVHSGKREHVVASRIVRGPGASGTTRFVLRSDLEQCVVMASAFNRLRQRSDIAAASADRL